MGNSRFFFRNFFRFNLIMIVVSLSAWAVVAAPVRADAEVREKMIELVIDASWSMNSKLQGGETKADIARKSIMEFMENFGEETVIALRAYGHGSSREEHDCRDTELLVPFGRAGEAGDEFSSELNNISARGSSPLAFVLQKAVDDFPETYTGEKIIILVSDGRDTCEGDACVAARELAGDRTRFVVHTIGLNAGDPAKLQLGCIARITGGKYFEAESALQLVQALAKAAGTGKAALHARPGSGSLKIIGADLSGHAVTRADTGERVGTISSDQTMIVLPAGIYNVAFGKTSLKSVEVRSNETTVLKPGVLHVENASLTGNKVLDAESGFEHGSVSALKSRMTLMPGEYDVVFGNVSWPVTVFAGKTTTLQPGTVKVDDASQQAYTIRDAGGRTVVELNNVTDWTPLPPGEYTIEIDGREEPFSLKEGRHVRFRR
jgi:hypothetical protein